MLALRVVDVRAHGWDPGRCRKLCACAQEAEERLGQEDRASGGGSASSGDEENGPADDGDPDVEGDAEGEQNYLSRLAREARSYRVRGLHTGFALLWQPALPCAGARVCLGADCTE